MKKYLLVLKKSPLFAGLSDEEISGVLQCTSAKTLHKKKGQTILLAGDTVDSIGMVLQGSAIAVQEDLWGNRNVVTKIFPGDIFAEPFAAKPNSILDLSVIADEDCAILKMNVQKLFSMCPNACDYHNRLVRNMASVLAEKALALNKKITHISKRKTRDKILSYLSAESIRQKSLKFDIPFDRQQLADYLCIERSAMSAELSKLQKEGLIKTSKSHFELKTEREFSKKTVLRERRIPFEIAEADPFYSKENQKVLAKSIKQLRSGKGVAHDLIEADDE